MKKEDAVIFLLVSAAGMAAVSAAPFLVPHAWTQPPYGILRQGVEDFSKVSALGLFFIGLAAGYARPQKAWVWGWASMVLYPVVAFMEMGQDPASHNLWPLEFICYGAESLCAVAGSHIGGRLRSLSRPDTR